ncbi:MAG: hypothetical protein GY940_14755 [bacterium]|nr:hypothetical protein [bacterium]
MDKKEILKQLKQVSKHLDTAESHIETNDWDAIAGLFSNIDDIQSKIKTNDPPIETLMAQNLAFKKEYEDIKTALLEKTTHIIATIETWKTLHTEKISGSKNVLDNISKFYQPPTTS